MMTNKLTNLYFPLWFGGALWCVSDRFVDAQIMPKWYFFVYATLLLFYIGVFRLFLGKTGYPSFKALSASLLSVTFPQAVYGLLQGCGLCGSTTGFVAGSFDNPAGFASALVFSVPFGLWLTQTVSGWQRRAAWTAVLICVLAIIVSGSRAGMLALCAVVMSFIFMKMRRKRHFRLLLLGMFCLSAALAVALYHYKKDSADGRLLIWQCTLQMIREQPWTGHGVGGFRAGYMNEQADFFRQHPDSPYARLADDVKSPFNEYLAMGVDFGLVGMLLPVLCMGLMLYAWKRHPGGTSRPALLCLTAISVFSLFSYPFRYPHTWMLCGMSALLLLRNARLLPSGYLRAATVGMAVLFTALSVPVTRRMVAEMRWCDAANRSLCGQTEKMLPVYRELEKVLGDDPLFLYNHAAELNVAGRYEESLMVAQKCESLMADYFTQLLLADNYQQLGRTAEAEECLHQASLMCPNRFVPLYELYRIHEQRADTASMQRTAKEILSKPIKVDSPEVQRIIREIKNKHNNQSKTLNR